jgi:hypothetical protein
MAPADSSESAWRGHARAAGAFYGRKWIEEEPKRQALFEAQEKTRIATDELGQPTYQTVEEGRHGTLEFLHTTL